MTVAGFAMILATLPGSTPIETPPRNFSLDNGWFAEPNFLAYIQTWEVPQCGPFVSWLPFSSP